MKYLLSYSGKCCKALRHCRKHALYILLLITVLHMQALAQAPADIQLPVKEIHENNLLGTAVGAFMSNDANSSTYVYTLVAGADDTDNAAFTIDTNGILRAAIKFDYETQATYNIRVRATNPAGLYVERAFAVIIADVYETPNKLEANNILTPNGDGINDVWVIKNLDLGKNNELFIYDRVGRLVFTKKNYQNDWNGAVNGNHIAEGTYYYVIDLGPSKYSGFITLIRERN
jgi:gliding motility-associated-like protein